MRLQHLHAVGAEEFVYRIVRVLEVGQLPCSGRTGFAAGGGQSLADAVIAKRALVRYVMLRVDIPASIWTRLHTVTAAEAVGLVDQHQPVGRLKGRAHRADLDAGGMLAVV